MSDTITNSLAADGLIAGPYPVVCDTVTVKLGLDLDRGTVLGKEDGTSAVVTAGNDGPYNMAAGDTLVLDIDNAGNDTATFDAASGSVTDTTSYASGDQTGLTEKITIDGGEEQTITFGTATTALLIAEDINDQLVGGSASVVGGQVVVTSDSKGTGSTVAIGTGTCELTWDTPVAGTGDVVSIDAVTVAEIKTVLEADIAGITVAASGSAFTITSDAVGTSSEVDVKSGNVATVCDLTLGATAGTGGSGNSVVCDADGDDGSEDPQCVLAEDCDASSAATVAAVYRTGTFNTDELTFASGTTAAEMKEKMAAKGMFQVDAVDMA